jgi:hypothetical protein
MQRLKRVFAVEIERCGRCGGKLEVIASIEEPQLIERILAHVQRAPEEDEPAPFASRRRSRGCSDIGCSGIHCSCEALFSGARAALCRIGAADAAEVSISGGPISVRPRVLEYVERGNLRRLT